MIMSCLCLEIWAPSRQESLTYIFNWPGVQNIALIRSLYKPVPCNGSQMLVCRKSAPKSLKSLWQISESLSERFKFSIFFFKAHPADFDAQIKFMFNQAQHNFPQSFETFSLWLTPKLMFKATGGSDGELLIILLSVGSPLCLGSSSFCPRSQMGAWLLNMEISLLLSSHVGMLQVGKITGEGSRGLQGKAAEERLMNG